MSFFAIADDADAGANSSVGVLTQCCRATSLPLIHLQKKTLGAKRDARIHVMKAHLYWMINGTTTGSQGRSSGPDGHCPDHESLTVLQNRFERVNWPQDDGSSNGS